MELIKELFSGTDDYIEVREIAPDNKVKQLFFKYPDIESYEPPENRNIYFGVFNRDKRKGKAVDCSTTKTVWADYDNMESLTVTQRLEEVKGRLLAASIPEPSLIVSSGNGLHSYWLLDKRTGGEVVEVNRAIAELTGGDIKATDKARILRLPNTNNVKEPDNIKRCEVVQADNGARYSLESLIKSLGDNIKASKPELTQVSPEPINDILSSIKPDRPCIAAILKGVGEGERNFTLGRLTKWLQVKGYTKVKAKAVVKEWNRYNIPPENKDKLEIDFYQYWKGDYKLLGCGSNNPELQQILNKYCNRAECNFSMAIGSIKLDNSIPYNNRLLSDIYNITGNDLVIYGVLARHKEGLTTSQLTEKITSRATKKPCMSKPTRIKTIGALSKLGFVEVIEGNKTKGRDNLYKAIPQGNFGLGYTLLSNGAINGAIDRRVTAGELRLYILLLKYAFGKGSCYPSLDTLAKELRTSPSYISKTLKSLEENDYIKRVYKVFDDIEKLDIRLLV